MTSHPNIVEGILAFIGERREALAELEASIMKVAHLFGQSITTAIAPAVAAPALPPAPTSEPVRRRPGRPKKAAAPTPRTQARGRGRVDRSALEADVLAWLGKQRQATTFGALVAGVKSRPVLVRSVLDPLVEAGRVVRVGIKKGQRIGLPAVMAGASAPSPTTPPAKRAIGAKASTDTTEALIEALEAKIASGASYAPAEVLRALRLVDASVTLERATGLLEQFAREGAVERIPISEGVVRYRKRGKTR